jgi:hypothetical protein
MTELFRYIEQSFIVPTSKSTIDVERKSDLQSKLRTALAQQAPPEEVRGIANKFIERNFPSVSADPLHLGQKLLAARRQLLNMASADRDATDKTFEGVMGRKIHAVAGSSDFAADKALLDDTLVCVKIVTGFNKVNAHSLVAVRQMIAFAEDFDAGTLTDFTPESIRNSLRRPIRIPQEFVKPQASSAAPTPVPTQPDSATLAAAAQRTRLMAEQKNLKAAYHLIMSLQPQQFARKPSGIAADRSVPKVQKSPKGATKGEKSVGVNGTASARAVTLTLPRQVSTQFGTNVQRALEQASVDPTSAPVVHVLAVIKKQWEDVSGQLAPFQIPSAAKVFRVGAHLFTVSDVNSTTTTPRTRENL